jgi:dihydropteridine reductase
MLGYGLSKVGAHHFVQTLGDSTGKAVTPKAKRKSSRKLQARQHGEYLDSLTVVGILPTTIDTPSNRDAMPKADFNKWTQPGDIAQEIGTWITKPPLRPHSGSLVKVVSGSDGATFHLAR